MKSKERFLNYLKAESKKAILALLLVLVFVVSQLAQPYLLGKAIDYALNLDSNLFLTYIIICASLTLCGIVTGYFFEYTIGLLTQNLIKKMRDDVYQKINSLPANTLYHYSKGNILQLEIGDIENVSNGIFAVLKSFIEGILMIVLTIVLMFMVNWVLALGVIILSPLSILVSNFIAKFSHKSFKKQAELQAKLNALSLECIDNSDLIQSFNYEERSEAIFKEGNASIKKNGVTSLFSASWINPSTRLVNNTIYVIIGVVGIIIIFNEDMSSIAPLSIGGLISFLSYTNQYTKPFNEISNAITEFETARSSFARINDFLNNEDDLDNGTKEIQDIKEINFVNMNFSYDLNKPLITNFNQLIKKGQRVAIVGPTGAGKTTLINVLMNFYSPQGGDIKFNYVSQSDIKKSSLRDNFAMVLQDTWVFSGSIMDNVRYGRVDASDEEVINACKFAHADTFINTLPHGYQTVLKHGQNLSEGQKQMLSIARAIVANKDILILDEATSNIDTHSEKLINDAFDKLLEGKTSIVIAHRLSTIKSADIILVLKDGSIVEQGSHKELMKKRGFYYSLYASQFRGEQL